MDMINKRKANEKRKIRNKEDKIINKEKEKRKSKKIREIEK